MSTITDPQRRFIESLLSTKLTTLGMADMAEATAKLNLNEMSKEDASVIIGRLKGMANDEDEHMPNIVKQSAKSGTANRAGICSACECIVHANAGYYYLMPTGKWAIHHRKGECFTTDKPEVTTMATIEAGIYLVDGTPILVYKTKNDRLAGKVLRGSRFVYEQGAVNRAAMGVRVTAEVAATYGATKGHCIACGLDLNDPRSNPSLGGKGYGPVCAKKYNWPWGDIVDPITGESMTLKQYTDKLAMIRLVTP